MLELSLIVILFLVVYDLKKQVDDLKRFVKSSPQGFVSPSSLPGNITQSPPMPVSNLENTSNANASLPTKNQGGLAKEEGVDIFVWFSNNWLLKVGVLLFLTGFGWFISYAFIHNWIGPVGRVILGFAISILFASYGTFKLHKDPIQSNLFIVLGSALTLITAYASYVVYGFFGIYPIVGITFLVSFFVAICSLMADRPMLGAYGVLIAFTSSIFVHSVQDIAFNYIYLCVVTAGYVWLAVSKDWRPINLLLSVGFLLNLFIDLVVSNNGMAYWIILPVTFILGFIFFAVSISGMILSKDKGSQSDVAVAVLNSISIILVVINIIPSEWQSLVLAFWMVVFGIGSFLVFFKTGQKNYFYAHCINAIGLLGVATTLELSGPALTIAYCIEVAVISIASYMITQNVEVGLDLLFLIVIPAFLGLQSLLLGNWSLGFMSSDVVVAVLAGCIMMMLGTFYYFILKNYPEEVRNSKTFYKFVNIIGSAYLLFSVWQLLKYSTMNSDLSISIALIVYVIVGISTYLYGLFQSKPVLKGYGLCLLMIVILRLIIVDIWRMDLAVRIVLFILIGLLFIATAFLNKKSNK